MRDRVQTTPGCNEGLHWIVFEQPLSVTAATLEKMREFVAKTTDATGAIVTYRDNDRPVQPLNGRTVWRYGDAGALAILLYLRAVHSACRCGTRAVRVRGCVLTWRACADAIEQAADGPEQST